MRRVSWPSNYPLSLLHQGSCSPLRTQTCCSILPMKMEWRVAKWRVRTVPGRCPLLDLDMQQEVMRGMAIAPVRSRHDGSRHRFRQDDRSRGDAPSPSARPRQDDRSRGDAPSPRSRRDRLRHDAVTETGRWAFPLPWDGLEPEAGERSSFSCQLLLGGLPLTLSQLTQEYTEP
ncbi:uncharacterized protein LOC121724676 isoform X2 [Alosa sapidissima]|uniref:uncharacterized protein LOC121724676 isoform X2 n=1 Tax=Alosa sapidissima TaxID=34773 RepID=UPI001C0848BD|nr:uncharacterized protein LOC121724676 isoform X2 [Alosa sapidissima]